MAALELLAFAAGVGLGFIIHYAAERYVQCRAMWELVRRIREGETECLAHTRLTFKLKEGAGGD